MRWSRGRRERRNVFSPTPSTSPESGARDAQVIIDTFSSSTGQPQLLRSMPSRSAKRSVAERLIRYGPRGQ
eukprot:10015578-Heterocapsa_arctica.AAC.1